LEYRMRLVDRSLKLVSRTRRALHSSGLRLLNAQTKTE
jgi:hypothetical protein